MAGTEERSALGKLGFKLPAIKKPAKEGGAAEEREPEQVTNVPVFPSFEKYMSASAAASKASESWANTKPTASGPKEKGKAKPPASGAPADKRLFGL